MQSNSTDKKLSVLYDQYQDRDFVSNAQKEVEVIRRKALYTGAATTVAGFVINEVTRLTMRNPLFKLKLVNVLLWTAGPTIASKYYYENHIHERIDTMWRIHQNRVNKGLGGTYKPSGIYDDKMQEFTQDISSGLQVSLGHLVSGNLEKTYLDNPFQRFHESIEQYPDFQDDFDDITLRTQDNFERFKPFAAKEGTTIGNSSPFPLEDNDQKPPFYDLQGESIYTNPPDTNVITMDHGLDEDHIWAFTRTAYNQFVIRNQYLKSPWGSTRQFHQPFWGTKFFLPSFYKEEKLAKFYKQWGWRIGLENIKLRQAISRIPFDKQQEKDFKLEIEKYMDWVQDQQLEDDLKEVYITNHEPKQKKYFTTNPQEDEEFFRYQQSLQQYNQTKTPHHVLHGKSSKYEIGSFLQRVLDPIASAKRLENGTLFFEISDQDMEYLNFDDDKLREYWEKCKQNMEEASELADDDEEALMTLIYKELEETAPQTIEVFNEILDRELSVFKRGEKYTYIKDLKEAFSVSQTKSEADRIFETIPHHAFWDIKAPLQEPATKFKNPYNPVREYPFSSFFDFRDYEEYNERREVKNNLRDDISLYRRY